MGNHLGMRGRYRIFIVVFSPSLWLYSPWALALFSFSIFNTVDRTPWTGNQPVARPLPTHRKTQTQNKRTQTSMPRMGFETTIPEFERAKTVHALDRATIVIGIVVLVILNPQTWLKIKLDRQVLAHINVPIYARI
jgi:hypothetical protein